MKIQTLLAKHKSPTNKIKSHESHDVRILVHTQLTKKLLSPPFSKKLICLYSELFILFVVKSLSFRLNKVFNHHSNASFMTCLLQ